MEKWRTKAIYAGELHRQREQKDGRKTWGVYHNGISSYDERFACVLENGSFEQLVKPGWIALDCFAPTSFLRDLGRKTPLRGGVAIALTDTRRPEEKTEDCQRRIVQVEANFYIGDWRFEVDKFLREHGRLGFDLITCAPVGGWIGSNECGFAHSPPREQLYWTANELWKLLDNRGKLFIAYVTHEQDWLADWVNKITSLDIGTSFATERQTLALEKTINNLANLPFL